MKYKAFKCPNCGGYKWGTHNVTSTKDNWVGYCNGSDDRIGCGFKWKRIEDDEKVMTEDAEQEYR